MTQARPKHSQEHLCSKLTTHEVLTESDISTQGNSVWQYKEQSVWDATPKTL